MNLAAVFKIFDICVIAFFLENDDIIELTARLLLI